MKFKNFLNEGIDFNIGDNVYNVYYAAVGEIIDMDLSIDEITVEWDHKKLGTEVYSKKDFGEIRLPKIQK